ncbi:hypothetical protein GCM10009838_68760 [Catenulispora subtropica]|uniref:Uncharacterized protein n=1 Tax=Catenulispora subtropica TaxID=450798 RepID=A0ABP5EC54_9ACTN
MPAVGPSSLHGDPDASTNTVFATSACAGAATPATPAPAEAANVDTAIAATRRYLLIPPPGL